MALPGLEAHIQPLLAQISAIAIVDLIRQAIAQPPCVFLEIAPRQVDPALSRRRGQIDHDNCPVLAVVPAPSHEILEARVIGPPGTAAQAPVAFVK